VERVDKVGRAAFERRVFMKAVQELVSRRVFKVALERVFTQGGLSQRQTTERSMDNKPQAYTRSMWRPRSRFV
jgi:hypothetical protein